MTITDYVLSSAAGIQAIATVVLAIVTIVYAKSARKMAKEMEEQRLAARPFVIPDTDIRYDTEFVNSREKSTTLQFPVSITNAGKEAAVELILSLEFPKQTPIKHEFQSINIPLLMPDQTRHEWFIDYTLTEPEEGKKIEAEYPPDGHYELKVSFRPVSSPDASPSEISLPFELSCPKGWGKKTGWLTKIERGKLEQKLASA